jgi:hypothetical protein
MQCSYFLSTPQFVISFGLLFLTFFKLGAKRHTTGLDLSSVGVSLRSCCSFSHVHISDRATTHTATNAILIVESPPYTNKK